MNLVWEQLREEHLPYHAGTCRAKVPGLCVERAERSTQGPEPEAFEQQHYNIAHWAGLWGFSAKTVREWFRDEAGPGILRQPNTGRRKRRDYTTMMISPIAAARVYSKRTEGHLIN